MSIHISAKPVDIAPIVLMPGDPLRAKHVAENYLENYELVSSTRGMFYFTGYYKNKRLTVGASGMGCPSIGIYSYELYNEYGVECIMRIGTCGAYHTTSQLFDIINASKAFSESTYAKFAFGYEEQGFDHQGKVFDVINETAKKLNMNILQGHIHSGDAFYRIDRELPKMAVENNCLAAEMEAFALFANAKHFRRSAATLLTVSDIIPAHKMITAKQREKSLGEMTTLALESVLAI